ncbi:MAG: hypothetical protein HYX46_00110 [Betaproteobacteria bacterium]|nr:hypothetical protein [Betaproteobacteria bacterium]
MTAVALAVASIVFLASLAWLAGKEMRVSVCPICFGVAGTWLWMVGARFAGFAIDPTMLAILLGASVVGIAYQLEPRLPEGRSQLLWKALVLPIGFVAAYGLVAERWGVAGAAALALALVAAFFLLPRRPVRTDEAVVKKLQEQMKKCC